MGEYNAKLIVCGKEVAAAKASLAQLRRISNAFKAENGDLRTRCRSVSDESRALMHDCDDLLTCRIGETRR